MFPSLTSPGFDEALGAASAGFWGWRPGVAPEAAEEEVVEGLAHAVLLVEFVSVNMQFVIVNICERQNDNLRDRMTVWETEWHGERQNESVRDRTTVWEAERQCERQNDSVRDRTTGQCETVWGMWMSSNKMSCYDKSVSLIVLFNFVK